VLSLARLNSAHEFIGPAFARDVGPRCAVIDVPTTVGRAPVNPAIKGRTPAAAAPVKTGLRVGFVTGHRGAAGRCASAGRLGAPNIAAIGAPNVATAGAAGPGVLRARRATGQHLGSERHAQCNGQASHRQRSQKINYRTCVGGSIVVVDKASSSLPPYPAPPAKDGRPSPPLPAKGPAPPLPLPNQPPRPPPADEPLVGPWPPDPLVPPAPPVRKPSWPNVVIWPLPPLLLTNALPLPPPRPPRARGYLHREGR
jgi:hypothetical protein